MTFTTGDPRKMTRAGMTKTLDGLGTSTDPLTDPAGAGCRRSHDENYPLAHTTHSRILVQPGQPGLQLRRLMQRDIGFDREENLGGVGRLG